MSTENRTESVYSLEELAELVVLQAELVDAQDEQAAAEEALLEARNRRTLAFAALHNFKHNR